MNCLQKLAYRTWQHGKNIAMSIIFPKFPTPKIIDNSIGLAGLPKFMRDLGLKKPLFVADPFLYDNGMCDTLINAFNEIDMPYALYTGVKPNPPIACCDEAVKLYTDNGCDSIVVLGGGSSIDCAKAAGAKIVRPKKSYAQMKGELKVLRKLPTFFAIPTTSGTGSEATLAAVITDPDNHDKYALKDPFLIPNYAVFDVNLTVGLPPHLTSTTGMDALVHAVEAFINVATTRDTDRFAREAVKDIHAYLKRAYDNGKDIEAREKMQFASLRAGQAFTRAYVGYVHALAHALGGFYGVPHGLANAILLPYVLEAFGASAHKKLAILATDIGLGGNTDEEKANAFITWVKDLNASMDIPTKLDLTKYPVKEEDIEKLVEHAYDEAHPDYPVPRFLEREELTAIIKQIL